MAIGPTNTQIHTNAIMTDFLLAYMQDVAQFVAERAFPVQRVAGKSDSYYKLTRKYWFSDEMEERASGSEYARSGFAAETADYLATVWGLEKPVDDMDRANADAPIDLDYASIEWLAQKLLLRKERDWASQFMTTSVWGTDNTSSTDWDDASGVPVTDVLTAQRTILQATGRSPRYMVCGDIVWRALLVNAQIVDLMKYTTAMTDESRKQMLAGVLGLDNIYVGGAIYNTANIGQTASYSPIMDDDALVLHIDAGAGVFGATAGKCFAWTGHGAEGMIETYREDKINSDVHRAKAAWDFKLVASELGYFFSDIV